MNKELTYKKWKFKGESPKTGNLVSLTAYDVFVDGVFKGVLEQTFSHEMDFGVHKYPKVYRFDGYFMGSTVTEAKDNLNKRVNHE